jgi:type IV pilus assembly protein PilB
LITRLRKILLGDTSDRSGLVQQGTALLKLQNRKELDLSYHIHPTAQRDQILIKLKDRYHVPVLNDLDLSPDSQQALQEVLTDLQGMVLVTGTAKSGVTTTLYTLLNTLYKPHLHMLSIENPVEMLIDGIIQGSVREDAGYSEHTGHTYEEYVHYAFHQRPDVLMIDRITAPELFHKLAMFSSGSLVVSSLPALDTASAAITLRLLTSPGFLGTYVTCITAQRLVRTICESCKEEVVLPAQHRKKLGFGPDDRCYAGKGCDRCDQTGYIGLTPIFEVMRLTEPLKQALMRANRAADLRMLQADHHVASLRDDGMRKVKEGITTIQEVVKATML